VNLPVPAELDVAITHLEMHKRPAPSTRGQRRYPFSVATFRVENCPIPFYRFLYAEVGREWLWYERRALSDAALSAAIHVEGVDILVLYAGGAPAGYAELDKRETDGPGTQIRYFGLMPGFLGKGLGDMLMSATLDRVWSADPTPSRLWVHTCTLDHPGALAFYQRWGFNVFAREQTQIIDPRPLD